MKFLRNPGGRFQLEGEVFDVVLERAHVFTLTPEEARSILRRILTSPGVTLAIARGDVIEASYSRQTFHLNAATNGLIYDPHQHLFTLKSA